MNATLVAVLLLTSTLFAVGYLIALSRLSRSLVSAYPKADANRRLGAAMVDGLFCTTFLVVGAATLTFVPLVVGGVYVIVRDGLVPGQSIGKLVFGLTVIQLDGGGKCTLSRSVKRNIIFGVPGLNLLAVVFEAFLCCRDPQGQRLGDKLAQTQVVVGKDAKELVKALQKSLLDGLSDLERVRNRRPKPVAEKV